MMIPLSELIKDFGVKPRGIIHVGAHEAQELESYIECQVPQAIWIEANPEIYKNLTKRLEPFPHHKAYQFAAHETDNSTVELHVMVNTMSSSILQPKKHLEFYPSITVTEKIKVPTKTLDTFINEEKVPMRNYNFLNMDIQGAELLCLKGGIKNLKHFDYIYTEVNDDELFEGCCQTSDLDNFLGDFGFKRLVRRMTSDKWGDALYVRNY